MGDLVFKQHRELTDAQKIVYLHLMAKALVYSFPEIFPNPKVPLDCPFHLRIKE